MKYGYLTVAAAVPRVRLADPEFNAREMAVLVKAADDRGAELLVFPELSTTGYSCQDLFFKKTLLDASDEAVLEIADATKGTGVAVVFGAPVRYGALLLNCAVVVQGGVVRGVVPKKFLPNYGEFYEKRWFASSLDLRDEDGAVVSFRNCRVPLTPRPQLFGPCDGSFYFGVEVCEDLWSPEPPGGRLAMLGADVVVNLSASDELVGKHEYLKSLVSQQSARSVCGYVYAGCGYGESTQDVVYGGNVFVCENGRIIAQSERFRKEPQLVVSQIDVEKLRTERRANSTFQGAQSPRNLNESAVFQAFPARDSRADSEWRLLSKPDPLPFVPKGKRAGETAREVLEIQSLGLARRIEASGAKRLVLGVSGGLDSTLALIVCAKALDFLCRDRKEILGVTMPGFGTTERTLGNSLKLMRAFGAETRKVDIRPAVTVHFEDSRHDPDDEDVTFENCQARERTQVLMDLSNQESGIVVGTGDMSELALGWCTYNGDHMSMYAVNSGVPKTLVRSLIGSYADEVGETDPELARILRDVLGTPISPELKSAGKDGKIEQKSEDAVGPYELQDFYLYHFMRFGFGPRKLHMLATEAFGGKYSPSAALKWLRVFFRRFFTQQFKRSCLPDGPKVGSVSLSPRGDWRMPSDAAKDAWTRELDAIGAKLAKKRR